MKKGLCLMCLAVLLCMSLLACQRREQSATARLQDLMHGAQTLPTGIVYHKDAEEGSKEYLSPSLIAAMYGENADEEYFPMISDYAVYLSSFAEPYEIAVFCCYSATDAEEIAKMCLARLDILRVALATSAYREMLSCAEVRIEGRSVILYIAEKK